MESQEQAGKNEQQRVSDAVQSNLEKVEESQRRQEGKRSPVQKLIERASIFFSSPRFLVIFLSTTVAWIGADLLWHTSGHPDFDEHAKTLQAMTNPDDVLAEIESRHVVPGEKRDDNATGIQGTQ